MKHAPGTVEDRLTRLERSAARWRAGALAAVAVLAIVMLGAAGDSEEKPGTIDTLSVHNLRVVDKDGHGVVAITVDQKGAGAMVLSNGTDKGTITLQASPSLPTITVVDQNGKSGVKMIASERGGVLMGKHSNGATSFQAGPTEKGGVLLETLSLDGSTIWIAPMTAIKPAPPKTLPPPKF